MVTGKDRVQLEAIREPVSISSVRVRQGDLVMGDESGVVVVPQERVQEVLTTANEIESKEKQIEKELEKGSTLRDARRKFGYHTLQRPRA